MRFVAVIIFLPECRTLDSDIFRNASHLIYTSVWHCIYRINNIHNADKLSNKKLAFATLFTYQHGRSLFFKCNNLYYCFHFLELCINVINSFISINEVNNKRRFLVKASTRRYKIYC